MIKLASWHFIIAEDEIGTNALTFPVNPIDLSGLFPERAETKIPVLGGSAIRQLPEVDTRERSFVFDMIPDEAEDHRDFVLEDLKALAEPDGDGQRTIYYLTIPDELARFRPDGYEDEDAIPIRVLDVIRKPESPKGSARWYVSVVFEIVPDAEI